MLCFISKSISVLSVFIYHLRKGLLQVRFKNVLLVKYLARFTKQERGSLVKIVNVGTKKSGIHK